MNDEKKFDRVYEIKEVSSVIENLSLKAIHAALPQFSVLMSAHDADVLRSIDD